MRLAINGTHLAGTLTELVHAAREVSSDGLSTLWLSQGFRLEALTTAAVVGREVGDLRLGTAVVPAFGRHPQVLAAQALTVQAALGDRFVLGVGLSHRTVVEDRWGYSYRRPLSYMREYLDALVPLLQGDSPEVYGEQVTSVGGLDVPATGAPGLLLAALGPRMLRLAGRATDGTIIGNAGPRAVAEHVVPVIEQAAADAGRPAPQVVANVPVCVTDDPDRVRTTLAERLTAYGRFPSFQRMLELEGAGGPEDVALVGSEAEVREGLRRFDEAGVTDLAAVEMPTTRSERERTRALLVQWSSTGTGPSEQGDPQVFAGEIGEENARHEEAS